ncbi:MAG: hypothetical protein LBE12_10715 [Planctomycetaceae bacterium]|jgi:hypothetical protein|nr:hypothetical protein [Planctomycetaceae bacterium]
MISNLSEFERLKSKFTKIFEKRTGLTGLPTEIKDGGLVLPPTLVFRISKPTTRHYRILLDIVSEYNKELEDYLRITILENKEDISNAEEKLFQRTLSESLTVNQYSFRDDFFSRYIATTTGIEEQIISLANHIVFGRRGSGKSTLLLYALRNRENDSNGSACSVWVDLQTYSKRTDNTVIADVLCEIIDQLAPHLPDTPHLSITRMELIRELRHPEITMDKIRTCIPRIRSCLNMIFETKLKDVILFLDDFHLVVQSIQPVLLDILYCITRGTNIYLKISSIETLTQTFDPATKTGMQIGHDLQKISLDYNLTTPDLALEHVRSILDSIAVFCGLSSILKLCTNIDVLKRLVWVTAGVPRDALSLFAQAMNHRRGKVVSVPDINNAASNLLTTKENDLKNDSSEQDTILNNLIKQIKEFCFKRKNNAFLVKKDNQFVDDIMRLADLRLLHIINEGFTLHDAGEKTMALILDYGYYVGERTSRNIDLFNPDLKKPKTSELRTLPVFSPLEQ